MAGRSAAQQWQFLLTQGCQRHVDSLSRPQLDAMVQGLPWQRIGEAAVITLL
jgi:hypothetical protein